MVGVTNVSLISIQFTALPIQHHSSCTYSVQTVAKLSELEELSSTSKHTAYVIPKKPMSWLHLSVLIVRILVRSVRIKAKTFVYVQLVSFVQTLDKCQFQTL